MERTLLAVMDWLESYIADRPIWARDIQHAAEEKFGEMGVSARTLNEAKGRLFYKLNDGDPNGPWRSFQRGKQWYWADEREMPAEILPSKREMDAILAKRRLPSKVNPVVVPSAPVVSVPIWQDAARLAEVIKSGSLDELKREISGLMSHPNWFENDAMVDAQRKLDQAITDREKVEADQPF